MTTELKRGKMKEKIEAFIKEINDELNPVACIKLTRNRIATSCLLSFDIELCPTTYLMPDQCVVTSKLQQLIYQMGLKHFQQEVKFNNTGRCCHFLINNPCTQCHNCNNKIIQQDLLDKTYEITVGCSLLTKTQWNEGLVNSQQANCPKIKK
jgi:hypothetical protein